MLMLWKAWGNNMLEITLDDVILINKECLRPGEPFKVLDTARIESALGNQYQPYELEEQAAASVYKSLVLNHGFANGNKRTAVLALLLLADSIGKELTCTNAELDELTYQIAKEGGGQISVNKIVNKLFGLKLEESVDSRLMPQVTEALSTKDALKLLNQFNIKE